MAPAAATVAAPGAASLHGIASMTDPLRRALLRRPGPAFAHAFEDPALGFLRPADLDAAVREHEAFVALLRSLGVDVVVLDEGATGDSVYAFDAAIVTEAGVIGLRSGKPNRVGEERDLVEWAAMDGIPVVGSIDAPGTVDGGDVLWLDRDTVCVGRSLRTNDDGIRQLRGLLARAAPAVEVRTFDVPYWHGPAECLHLLSVISPVAPDLAVVYPPLVPAGLWRLLETRQIATIAVADAEFDSLGANVLAVGPRRLVVASGNPRTRAALEAAGCEVHPTPLFELGMNGSGGPTCLVQPVRRG